MNKTKYCAIFLLIFSILSSCTVINDNSDSTLKGIQKIIEAGIVPNVFAGYDNMSEQIFSKYTPGAKVVARYVEKLHLVLVTGVLG